MAVDIHISEQGGVRFLHFSSAWIQGAMRIARPWALELDYTREMMTALLLQPEPHWPRHVLIVGLGAASLVKFLHRHRPDARLTVVETEPAVVAAARHYFKLPDDDARLRIVIGDGADFIVDATHHDARRSRYDLVLVDGYDADAGVGRLDSLPFYANVRARLTDAGLLVTNLLSTRQRKLRDSLTRLTQAFDGRALALPPCDSGNVIALAAAGDTVDTTIEELKDAALALKRATGLNLLPTVSRLVTSSICQRGRITL